MRYFLEVSYKGTRYSGFQIQDKGATIQGEIERALAIFFKETFVLTGSSRTDSGVHAFQNFFHFDWNRDFDIKWMYNLNAILPGDIVIKEIRRVADDAHSRFDALSRSYVYKVYQFKNAFLADTAYFYPYPLDLEAMNQAASLLKSFKDFSSFSKKNTQVKTFHCNLMESYWVQENDLFLYHVTANRFLRGMVRALVATMLRVGRQSLTIEAFEQVIRQANCGTAWFDAPARGLTLQRVTYPI
ncbi:tRNA pseudouridine(38-40) synthase TruA [Niabella drilacis]|uniref:tRNA pseudouridine synthase A n=1 Tax=Niabella drilacis (strain DSM 25811 / CCM 8410 / CCUG 62505 / LMG 26954 / E90) TaxID=1285928 RepID=A0A1G6TIK9_NIADE|nr:tRNA pseudouridine(38-40) synthase TruA [Niabella drilacis]SDD28267.1 tRNA pseudouridine38-40 synthase [Niabella drilacis]